jgi:NADH:ubiquinone oxidoreductase subunit D
VSIDPSAVKRYAHGSRVPGWDDAVDLTKSPQEIPDPATTPVPDALRAEIEGPRGELGCFVRSDGSSKPARVHMRDPSFVNLQSIAPMVRDSYLADLIATLAMLDPILGGIDR